MDTQATRKALPPDQDNYLVVFDLETGGINPQRHPIIQIAALAVDSRLAPVEAFECKVRFDQSQATKASLRKNHYSRAQWSREAIEGGDAARRFGAFLVKYASYKTAAASGAEYSLAQLVAHNAAFDGPFLQAWYERLELFLPARYQVLCTMQRAMWYFAEHPEMAPPANFKLATLCEHFRVPYHAARAHEALGDVTATFLLYQALSKGAVVDTARLTRQVKTRPA
jgi:DNA polymerase III epsilon subunit-like protein